MKEFIYKIIDLLTFKRGFNIHISGYSLRLPTRYYKYFESDYELNNINFINNNIFSELHNIFKFVNDNIVPIQNNEVILLQ